MLKEDWDKEFDTILRGTARNVFASQNGRESLSAEHLDADALNLFAENLLPNPIREKYVSHLAACNICRAGLREIVLLNEADEAKADEIHQIVETPNDISFGERLRRFLTVPVFGAVFGALALALVGAFVFVSNSTRTTSSEVAQSVPQNVNANINGVIQTPPTPLATMPDRADTFANANANFGTNSAPKPTSEVAGVNSGASDKSLPSSNAASPVKQPISPRVSAPPMSETAPKYSSEDKLENRAADMEVRRQSENTETETAQSAPPAPSSRTRSRTEEGVSASSAQNRALKTDSAEAMSLEVSPAPVARRAPSVITKKSEAKNSENPRKVLSGKTFEKRDGIWTDTTYNGQATQNIKRNSAEFEKLDEGLRQIAQKLGSAIIIWNGKAYRIE